MYNLYQINHIKFKNIVKIYISCQVLHKQQEAQLLLSNAEIFLQFIIRLKSSSVGAFLSELANLDHNNGPKYLMECLPYFTVCPSTFFHLMYLDQPFLRGLHKMRFCPDKLRVKPFPVSFLIYVYPKPGKVPDFLTICEVWEDGRFEQCEFC